MKLLSFIGFRRQRLHLFSRVALSSLARPHIHLTRRLYFYVSLSLSLFVLLTCLPLVFLFTHRLVFLSLFPFQTHPLRSAPHPSLHHAGLSPYIYVCVRECEDGVRWSETICLCLSCLLMFTLRREWVKSKKPYLVVPPSSECEMKSLVHYLPQVDTS